VLEAGKEQIAGSVVDRLEEQTEQAVKTVARNLVGQPTEIGTLGTV
jgi:hypothetical protein